MLLLLLACTGKTTGDDTAPTDDTGATDTGGAIPACAVVTDIDETLTTDDLEFVYQVADPDHDPEMRPDANTLMNAYADLGYTIVYLTGRGEGLSLSDGTSARDATGAWLEAHGFPWTDTNLYLSDSDLGLSGEEAHVYKADVLTGLVAEGWNFPFGYGNAEADIEAYQDIAVPEIFLVGELAGTMDVGAIPDDEAYTAHLAAFMGSVPACE